MSRFVEDYIKKYEIDAILLTPPLPSQEKTIYDKLFFFFWLSVLRQGRNDRGMWDQGSQGCDLGSQPRDQGSQAIGSGSAVFFFWGGGGRPRIRMHYCGIRKKI